MVTDRTVFVFEFEIYDKAQRRFRKDGRLATPSAISKLDGILVVGSRREVSADRVDAEGFYRTEGREPPAG